MAADPRAQRGLSSWVLQASCTIRKETCPKKPWGNTGRVPCARSTFSRLIFLGSLFGILARLVYQGDPNPRQLLLTR
eukprot:scaffold47072_cov66-Phaeocystis_antarctica.AAC.1